MIIGEDFDWLTVQLVTTTTDTTLCVGRVQCAFGFFLDMGDEDIAFRVFQGLASKKTCSLCHQVSCLHYPLSPLGLFVQDCSWQRPAQSGWICVCLYPQTFYTDKLPGQVTRNSICLLRRQLCRCFRSVCFPVCADVLECGFDV